MISLRNRRKATEISTNLTRGKQRSEEDKLKMSIAAMGNKNCVGRVLSEETRSKIGAGQLGRKRPEHTCPHCGKTVGGKGNLTQHLRKHQ